MKKTFNIHIDGTVFHIEHDAYDKLENYLDSIRNHFNSNPDKEEILKDIESRISEKFSEKTGVITETDVDHLIKVMGTVEQIEEVDETIPKEIQHEINSNQVKRLFRDKDNAIIAGVSSGLGHFFGVDPIVFRLLFIISVIAGGSGFFVYFLLWLLIPEAKTTAQKLSMKGNPVTISAMATLIKDKVDEVDAPGAFKKILRIPVDIINVIVQLIRKLMFPAVRVIIGSIMIIGSIIASVMGTIALGATLFSATPTFFEGPLLVIAQSMLVKVFAVLIYVIGLIPLIFFVLLGINLIFRKNFIPKTLALSLGTVWLVGVLIASILGTGIGMKVTEAIQNDPYYKKETVTTTLPSFNKVLAQGGQDVSLVVSSTTSITITGRPEALNNLTYEVIDGQLILSSIKEEERRCLFCDGDSPRIEVTVPTVTEIISSKSSHVDGKVSASNLRVQVTENSSVTLDGTVESLNAVITDSSILTHFGIVSNLTVDIKNNSEFNGEYLQLESANAKVANSSQAYFNATQTLIINALNSSRVRYIGPAKVEETKDASSSIRNLNPIESNDPNIQ